MEDEKNINKFISDICSKDYKEANNSLHKIIEDKLKTRIKQTTQTEN